MKKLLSAIIAGALLVPSTASIAQVRDRDRDRQEVSRDRDHSDRSYHRFKKGERFSRDRARNYVRLDHRKYRRLSSPPRGYVWVRSGDDALLVRLTSNVIAQVVTNLF